MKKRTELFIHPSEELIKLHHKSVCYDDSLLRLNNNKKYKESVKEFKKCDNKNFPGIVSPHLPKLHLNFAHNFVAITFTKLLRIYYFFILPFMATMVLGNSVSANSTVESDGHEASQGMQASGNQTSSITDAIYPLCNSIIGNDDICKNNNIIGPVVFFIISTFISIILGLIRRCCCGIGRSRRRRKRNAQMNEMDEEQMLQAQLLQQQLQQQQLQQLQMQQMLQMGQQLPFVGMLQETPIPDEGYQPVVQ